MSARQQQSESLLRCCPQRRVVFARVSPTDQARTQAAVVHTLLQQQQQPPATAAAAAQQQLARHQSTRPGKMKMSRMAVLIVAVEVQWSWYRWKILYAVEVVEDLQQKSQQHKKQT